MIDKAFKASWRRQFTLTLLPDQPLLATLMELADKLNAVCGFLSTLSPSVEAEQEHGLFVAELGIKHGLAVLEHFGLVDGPTPAMPINLLQAQQAVASLLAVVREDIQLGQMAMRGPDEDAGIDDAPRHDAQADAIDSPPPKRSDTIPDDEANISVRKFLQDNPKATARDVAKGVGIALGRVSQMTAWRAELGRRKAAKPALKKTPMPLTKKMTDAIKKGDDPGETAIVRETAWKKIIESATPSERANLHAMTTAERENLIEVSLGQFTEQLDEEADDDDGCS